VAQIICVTFQGCRIGYFIQDEQQLLQIVTVPHSVDTAEAIRHIETE
jgi:hypothetical protein